MWCSKKVIIFVLLIVPVFLFSQRTIPFKEDFNLIFIEVNINNKPLTFLFDNGCETSFLFDKKENFYKYKIIAKTLVYDADKEKDTVFITKCKIEIPALNIRKKLRMVITSPPLYLQEQGVSGVLGNDVISFYNWEIDFKKYKIKTYDKLDTTNVIKLADFKNKRDELSTILTINDIKDTFDIDLGFNQTLIYKQFLKKEENSYIKKGMAESIVKNRIIDSTFIITSDICFFNQHCFTNIPISWNKKNKRNLIGVGFLKEFDIFYIDNLTSTLWVQAKDSLQFYLPSVKVVNSKVMSITTHGEKNDNSIKIGDVLSEEQIKTLKPFKLPLSMYFRR